jgi:hypothetical protein
MENRELLSVLRSIDRRLALLTASEERALRERLMSDVLRTKARSAIFDAIDGQAGSPELANIAGVSDRAAQLTVKEFLDLGLVREVPGTAGRAIVVQKDDDAIIQWYIRAVSSTPPPEKSIEK